MLGKQEILIFIKRDTLEVYNGSSEGTLGRLEFPPDVYHAEEVVSEEKFKKMVGDFVSKVASGTKHATLAVAEEAVFFKENKASEIKDAKAQAESFFAEVPFDPENLAKKVIKKGDLVVFLATNKKLFNSIVSAVQDLGVSVDTVIPANLFIVSGASVLTHEQVKKLLERSDASREANLFEVLPKNIAEVAVPVQGKTAGEKGEGEVQDGDKSDDKPSLENDDNTILSKPKSNLKVILGILIFVVLLGVLGFLLYKNTNYLKKFLPKNSNRNQPAEVSSSPATMASSSAEASSSSKTVSLDAKINVLNGTGIAGQAQLVKNKLTDLGFVNVEIGNSQNTDPVTTVEFKANINNTTRMKVKDLLSGEFSEVTESVLATESTFDMVIITGKPK